jgi:4-amino-4-deoxy-L-arabinose transferase-like glycosyltransferase
MTVSEVEEPTTWGADDRTRYRVFGLFMLFSIALAARLGLAMYFGLDAPPVPGSDAAEYDQYAWNLAQGRGYRGGSPDVSDQDHLTAYRPPGLSLLWSGLFSLFGHRYDVIRIAHCLLGASACLLVWQVGRIAFNVRVAWGAAAIWAVFPSAVYFSTELLSETLTEFLLLASVLLCLRFAARPEQMRLACAAGGLLGLLLLTNASKILMLPFIVVWAAWQFRGDPRALVRAAAIPIVAVAMLVPWTVRNYLQFGEFIPVSTMGGSVLLQGNNRLVVTDPELYGYNVWDTKIPEYRDALRAADHEIERDRIAKRYAVEWIKSNPDKWLFMAQAKLRRGLTPFLKPHSPAHFRYATLFGWGPVLVLSAVAFLPSLVTCLRSGNPGWLIHLTIAHFLLQTVIFFGYARYRFPVEPYFVLLAVWGIDAALRRMQPSFGRTLNVVRDSLEGSA